MGDSSRVLQARLEDALEKQETSEKRIAELERRLDEAETPSEERRLRMSIKREEEKEESVDELIAKLKAKGVTVDEEEQPPPNADDEQDDVEGKGGTKFVKKDDEPGDGKDDEVGKRRARRTPPKPDAEDQPPEKIQGW